MSSVPGSAGPDLWFVLDASWDQIPAHPRRYVGIEGSMTCQELVEVLIDYVAGSLDASTRGLLETHLADCPECLEYLRSYRETIRLARTTATPEETVDGMPHALVDAILAAARGGREHE